MNLNEAARLLGLSLDVSAEMLDERLAALEQNLKGRIEAASSNSVKEKHRAALVQIRAAGELFRLLLEVNKGGTRPVSSATSDAMADAPAAPAAPVPEPLSPTLDVSPSPAPAPAVLASAEVAPPVAPAPLRGRRGTGVRILVALVVLIVGGVGAALLITRQKNEARLSVVIGHLDQQLRSAQARWAGLEVELATADQQLADHRTAVDGNPLLPSKPALAESEARARALGDFIAWYRPLLKERAAGPLLDELTRAISAKDLAEASRIEPKLRALLDLTETELTQNKPRLLAVGRPLDIVSEPAGLRYVLTDAYGRVVEGATPASVEVPWGLASVSITAPDSAWSDWRREFTVTRETAVELKAVFARTTVLVTSAPPGLAYELRRPGASVPLFRGVTPASLDDVPTGPVALRVSRPGWPDEEKTAEIPATPATLSVEFLPGSLSLVSEPAGAEVSQNGKSLGRAPLNLRDLVPGDHEFAMRLAGYETSLVRAQVKSGAVVEAKVELIRSPVLEKGQPYTVSKIGMRLMPVRAGRFLMGSDKKHSLRREDEFQHEVVISRDYWLGRFEVTRAEWSLIMNPAEPGPVDPLLPVTEVSWEDAMAFCRTLTALERASGRLPEGYIYTLPTEAQWEYACRAGGQADFPDEGSLDELGWFQLNSGGRLHPVGEKRPNAWGFHDMLGNASEWCSDWFQPYEIGDITDPEGASAGSRRVVRGSDWGSLASGMRSASRQNEAPTDRSDSLGFRVALKREKQPVGIHVSPPKSSGSGM